MRRLFVTSLALVVITTLWRSEAVVPGHVTLKSLTYENWTMMHEGDWMVEFYAPWCPACKSFQEVWQEFADWASISNTVNVAQVNILNAPELNGRFLVFSLPSIFHVRDGVYRYYDMSRNLEELQDFVVGQHHDKFQPIPAYMAPDSFMMAVVGHFFALAAKVRNFQNLLTNTYGLPYWFAYIMLVLITLICGFIIGLTIVFCCDRVYPLDSDDSAREGSPTNTSSSDDVDDTVPSGVRKRRPRQE